MHGVVQSAASGPTARSGTAARKNNAKHENVWDDRLIEPAVGLAEVHFMVASDTGVLPEFFVLFGEVEPKMAAAAFSASQGTSGDEPRHRGHVAQFVIVPRGVGMRLEVKPTH